MVKRQEKEVLEVEFSICYKIKMHVTKEQNTEQLINFEQIDWQRRA